MKILFVMLCLAQPPKVTVAPAPGRLPDLDVPTGPPAPVGTHTKKADKRAVDAPFRELAKVDGKLLIRVPLTKYDDLQALTMHVSHHEGDKPAMMVARNKKEFDNVFGLINKNKFVHYTHDGRLDFENNLYVFVFAPKETKINTIDIDEVQRTFVTRSDLHYDHVLIRVTIDRSKFACPPCARWTLRSVPLADLKVDGGFTRMLFVPTIDERTTFEMLVSDITHQSIPETK